jgi:zinc protease
MRHAVRTRPLALVLALFAACLASPLMASTRSEPGDIRKGEGRYPFEESVLDNGLRVISLEDHSTPVVAVQLWYHVGSKDEQVDRQGFAHMFEHMMFRGTDRLGPKDHFQFIRTTGGDCNAYTSFDQTVYVQELPANQLDMVLWLEAERMASLKIDEAGFATERKVVEEERRLGLNQPYGLVPETVLEFLFTEHPYRWTPIGQIEHLRAATPDDIQQFWDTYYVPNNATLVVVGDVSHAEVRRLAKKNFGWIPRCADPPRVTTVEPEQNGLRRLDIDEDNGPVPIAGIAFRAVPQGHPDALPLQMLMQILGGGESSRLYLELVRRQDVAVVALGEYISFEQAGLAVAGGVSMPFGSVDDIITGIWGQVELVKEKGVTEQELEKVRNTLYRNNVTESLTVASKAGALGDSAVLQGDAQLANTYLERIASVTPEDVQRVAKTYLIEKNANEVRISPSIKGMFSSLMSMAGNTSDMEEEEQADEESVDGGKRATPTGPKATAKRPEGYASAPPVAPPLDVDISIEGVRSQLDNGLGLVVVENHEVPFVSLSLRLRAGTYTEDPEFPGTAAMATSMVTRGTLARDAEALAEELERYAISLSANASHDSASVSASAVTGQLDRAARLFAEVVLVPAFDEEEFETLRQQTSTGMAIAEKTPQVQADRAFSEALWGEHPYGRPSEGTAEDLAELDVERLNEWWLTFVRPETATLYIAGDIDPERAQAIAERYFGDWEGEGEALQRPLPKWTRPKASRITLVDKPGAVQSQIRAGHEGVTRSHPQHATGVVLTQIFGGSFTSRLNDVLRVEKGLTYGAGGGLSSRRFGGEFKVSTFTKTPKTGETVKTLISEVRRMRDEAPTDEELQSAVKYLAGSFAGSLETPQSVASRLWSLELDDLPPDYWNDYLKRISSTQSEAVVEAARQLLDPDRLLIVVVGDAAQVQEDLEEIAEVDVVTSGG